MLRVPFRALAAALILAVVAFPAVADAGDGKPTAETLANSDVSLEAQRLRLWNAASPAAKAKVTPVVPKVIERANKAPNAPSDLLGATKSLLSGISEADIEAIAFLVLMQAAKSAQEDLKAIMAQVKAINDAKKCLRDKKCRDAIRGRAGLTKQTVDAIESGERLSELGEEQQLRLQLYMDRVAKLQETLQNVAQKVSTTKESIVGNFK
jgi:hypothetical protein